MTTLITPSTIRTVVIVLNPSDVFQVLMEDRLTNRLRESLNIFETIVNNRVFVNVSIILFLNKMDLLEEKVKSVPLKDYFPEYTGPEHSLSDVQAFMVECFRAKRRDATQKPLYHHFTTAINTENIRLVFRDVKDTILHDNLKQLMLQWPLSTCESRGPEWGQTTPSWWGLGGNQPQKNPIDVSILLQPFLY